MLTDEATIPAGVAARAELSEVPTHMAYKQWVTRSSSRFQGFRVRRIPVGDIRGHFRTKKEFRTQRIKLYPLTKNSLSISLSVCLSRGCISGTVII